MKRWIKPPDFSTPSDQLRTGRTFQKTSPEIVSPMVVFLNGEFLPEQDARISILDRGFLYGDALFETIRVHQGQLFQWPAHWHRLQLGAQFLRIPIPYPADAVQRAARQLLEQNQLHSAVLRLALSRGCGPRGYSTRAAGPPTFALTVHPFFAAPFQKPWRLIISSLTVRSNDPLAQFKTANKLPQILARREAEEQNADDAIFINEHGHVTEGTSCNLFWLDQNAVSTPPIQSGLLPGTVRSLLPRLCRESGLSFTERNCTASEFAHSDGMFVTLATAGLVPVQSVNEAPVPFHPAIQTLQAAYNGLLETLTP